MLVDLNYLMLQHKLYSSVFIYYFQECYGKELFRYTGLIYTHADCKFSQTEPHLLKYFENLHGPGCKESFIEILECIDFRVAAVNNLTDLNCEKTWFREAILKVIHSIQLHTKHDKYTDTYIKQAKKYKEKIDKEIDDERRKRKENVKEEVKNIFQLRDKLINEKVEELIESKSLKELDELTNVQLQTIAETLYDKLPDNGKKILSSNIIKLSFESILNRRIKVIRKQDQCFPCFPSEGIVLVQHVGQTKMSDLQLGDDVQTCDCTGKLCYQPIIMFSHGDQSQSSNYCVISFENGGTLSISPGHLLHIGSINTLLPAGKVKVGDTLFTGSDDNVQPTTVASIKTEVKSGVFAPHTPGGSIIVDDTLVSCYTTAIPSMIAHTMLYPVRLLYNTLPLSWFKAILPYDRDMGMPQIIAKYHQRFLVNY